MKTRRNVGMATVTAAILACTALTATADTARWKVHSAYSGTVFMLGEAPHYVADTVNAVTDGSLNIRVFDPGALVPSAGYYDAVSEGAIDAGFGTPGLNVAKNPAYAFFAAVPFGPDAPEYVAWFKHGGGQELAEEIYARDNIKFLLCGMTPPETSGWFRNEINTVEDLKGLKMRFFGLGAKVMERLGVSTQLLAAGDIYTALELGTIDATEFSMPAIDRDYGFFQIAKFNYFPGWHQPSTTNELLINMDRWNELTDGQRTAVQVACDANLTRMIAEGEASQFSAMAANEADGVQNMTWPDEILERFREETAIVLDEEASSSEDSRRVWESMMTFRAQYAVWGDRAYIK